VSTDTNKKTEEPQKEDTNNPSNH